MTIFFLIQIEIIYRQPINCGLNVWILLSKKKGKVVGKE